MQAKKTKKSINVLRWGAIFTFLSLVSLGSYLATRLMALQKNKPESTNGQEEVLTQKPTPEISWETYTNEEFGFTLEIPRLLYKVEYKDQGGYVQFVRFEENNFSQGKGVAVGVSQISLDEEVARIKEGFSQGAKLISETAVEINQILGKRLDFKPEADEAEDRTVVVFEKDGYSYSLSTHPSQIEAVVESFNSR